MFYSDFWTINTISPFWHPDFGRLQTVASGGFFRSFFWEKLLSDSFRKLQLTFHRIFDHEAMDLDKARFAAVKNQRLNQQLNCPI